MISHRAVDKAAKISRYNYSVLKKTRNRWFLPLFLLACLLYPAASASAVRAQAKSAAPAAEVSAYDLIAAMNTLRVSNGLPALVEDPIVNAVAQGTAEIMAANQMSSHIGDVRGRLASAGYGGGATVWATENFAVGNYAIDEIMIIWSDASHMIPAVNPAYCHVGAGVAKSSNGRTYYVLQAAYVGGQACGEYRSPSGGGQNSGGSVNRGVPGIIVPVKVATPDADGKIFHEVKAGQSFWAIAIAYKVTIKDLETWNNISRDTKLQVGQKLFIPSSNTEGYATPTPVGMVETSTPDAEGKIVHVVQPYQTLITIAQAYKVNVDTILAFNGILVDWPLQINQTLLISPGKATLSPIEKLKPEGDGRYYHTIQSGETLSWIAQVYGISVTELMNWNGLNAASILHPNQKLLLQITPPATATSTPLPASASLTATPALPSPTSSTTPVVAAASPTALAAAAPLPGRNSAVWLLPLGLAAGGLLLVVFIARRKQGP